MTWDLTSNTMILPLLRLLAAHLLADFLLQPRSWIEQKKDRGIRAPEFYYHVGTVGILTYLFLADWSHFWLPLFIIFTHFFIDLWKTNRPVKARFFVIDQLAHLLMIIIGWIFYAGITDLAIKSLFRLAAMPSFWIVTISYFVVIWPFGYLIAIITQRWQQELSAGDSDQLTGLQNAGMWIGRAERFIILTFILLNQYSAIGFLIAAKSVFRFSGKLQGNRERKEAEYILIGTLLSFALSISVGIGAQYLLNTFA